MVFRQTIISFDVLTVLSVIEMGFLGSKTFDTHLDIGSRFGCDALAVSVLRKLFSPILGVASSNGWETEAAGYDRIDPLYVANIHGERSVFARSHYKGVIMPFLNVISWVAMPLKN